MFILSLQATIGLSFALIAAISTQSSQKPNMIFITMDDVGDYDTGNDIPMTFYKFLEDSGVQLTNYVHAFQSCIHDGKIFYRRWPDINVGSRFETSLISE